MMDDLYTVFERRPDEKNFKFNLTFVKFASEIASLRVINGNRDTNFNDHMLHHNLAVVPPLNLGDDKTFINQVTHEFNRHIFYPQKPIANAVVKQILQLIFSFAIRFLLSLV
ncbi:hypothetical protein niasHT_013210 [Heterodera trifolii]|uniref:Uncharacterized protein n=1 Tax=Heterodera trifolii TaxID=157864 RepID=A0ABD2KXJ3_9BILA